MPTCPTCEGRKSSVCHVNRGDQPHTWERLPCSTCQGSGEVENSVIESHRIGAKIREHRKGKLWVTRDLAKRIGVESKLVSDAENGRLGPVAALEILVMTEEAVK